MIIKQSSIVTIKNVTHKNEMTNAKSARRQETAAVCINRISSIGHVKRVFILSACLLVVLLFVGGHVTVERDNKKVSDDQKTENASRHTPTHREMSWADTPAIVLDNGSGLVKCGFGGEDQPRAVFSSVVGRSLLRPNDPPLIGDAAVDAANRAGSGITLYYPLEHGIITDYDNMVHVWGRMFDELKVPPSEHACLLTEAPLNPKANREKMAEIMFEKFGVPALSVQIQAVMSLYSCGRTEGVVVDSGDGVTHVVPVFEGYTVPTAVRRLDLAGRDLTEWMMQLLNDEQQARTFSTTADREAARHLKEQACYVSLDFDAELEAYQEKEEAQGGVGDKTEFKLPDGTTFSVGKAAFCCPELLFSPSLANKECRSVPQTVMDCVKICPIDTRRALLNNVVLSGGSTMYRMSAVESLFTQDTKSFSARTCASSRRASASTRYGWARRCWRR